jgi:hypothetical protein
MSSPEQPRGRSALAWVTLAVAAISALGLVILLVGIVFDIEGAREGEEGPVIFNIAWLSFLLGGIAALALGAVSFFLGRSRRDAGTRQAGLVALGYAAVAIVVFVIASAT